MGALPWQCRSSAVAVPWSRGGEPVLEEQWGGLIPRLGPFCTQRGLRALCALDDAGPAFQEDDLWPIL
jgi:hypothetical protein